jgi:hypothetical protein
METKPLLAGSRSQMPPERENGINQGIGRWRADRADTE